MVSETWVNGLVIQSILGGEEAGTTHGSRDKSWVRWSGSTRDQGEQEQLIISRLFHLGGH